jgi:hypothetical protein
MTKRILFALLLVLPTIGAAGQVTLDPVPECLPCPPKPKPVASPVVVNLDMFAR